MNKKQKILEFRKAVQLFLGTLKTDTDADKMLAVASVFPKYEIGKAYKVGDVFSYGENAVGDAQLYEVVQEHTSSAEWLPEASESLYKRIGITTDGVPLWVQPLGAADAYNTGDVVSYNGTLYKSLIDNNVWSPADYPTGWAVI